MWSADIVATGGAIAAVDPSTPPPWSTEDLSWKLQRLPEFSPSCRSGVGGEQSDSQATKVEGQEELTSGCLFFASCVRYGRAINSQLAWRHRSPLSAAVEV